MIPVLTIVDDFLPVDRWRDIRAAILRDGFKTESIKEGPNLPEATYENVNIRDIPPDFNQAITNLYGRPIKMLKEAFRLGYKDSQLHNLVHADHCCAQLAAVYFLNPLDQCQGGTAFWRHKKFGWEMMPTQQDLDDVGYSIEEMAHDWQNSEAWEMVSLAGMRTNRIITYPTNAFHSRWPWQGFGDKSKPEEGRLVFCAFFDLV